MREVELKEIAYGRTGDKGDISNVGIIPYRGEDYSLLLEQVTVEHVENVYEGVVEGKIERYEYPGIEAINFVMYESLDGGVSRSLRVDIHGKSLHIALLDTEIPVSDEYEPPEVVDGSKVWSRD